MGSRRRVGVGGRTLLCLLTLALLLTACELVAPFQQQPTPSPPIPPRSSSIARAPSGPTADITLYLPRRFEDDSLGLSPARRVISASGEGGRQVLEMLIQGPSGDERADDFQYPLSIRTRIISFSVEDGTARVEFDQELDNVRGRPYSELVYWSIVYTLTEISGIRGVALTRSGRPLREFGYPPVAIPVTAARADAPAWVRPR